MKFLKLTTRFFGIICIAFFAEAQSIKEFVSIASPNATSLGIYGENPVSFSSGTADVNIPFYQLKEGQITVPIGLNYNTGGVKPDQHPGWVGLNWSLMAGGMITRVVKGYPDEREFIKGYFEENKIERLALGYGFNFNKIDKPDWSDQSNLEGILLADSLLSVEYEPDEFIFNFNGISGKFMMNEKGEYKVLTDPTIKVEVFSTQPRRNHHAFEEQNNGFPKRVFYYDSIITGFKITTSDGNQYEFGEWNKPLPTSLAVPILSMERSYDFFEESLSSGSWDTWLLVKISDANNNQSINFEYEQGAPILSMTKTIAMEKKENEVKPKGFFSFGSYSRISNYKSDNIHNGRIIVPLYLKKIISLNTEIIFNSSKSTELSYNYSSIIEDLANKYSEKYSLYDHGFSPRMLISGKFLDANYSLNQPKPQLPLNVYKYYRADIPANKINDFNPNTTNQIEIEYQTYYLEKVRNYNPDNDFFQYTGLYYNTNEPNATEIIDFNKVAWKRLNSIEIKNRITSQIVKTYLFNYNNNESQRLMLLNIEEQGENISSDKIPKYNFEYEDYNSNYYTESTVPLPEYLSGKTDHWGYFNNVNSEGYLNNAFGQDNYDETKLIGYKDQRNAVSKYMYAGILNKILLPTGGSITYTYEPNDYNKTVIRNGSTGAVSLRTETATITGGGLRIKKIETNANDGTPNIVRSYEYSPGILGGDVQYFWKDHQAKIKGVGGTYTSDRFVTQTQLPVSGNNSSGPVSYANVIEKISNNGKIEYNFTDHDTNLDENFIFNLDPVKSVYAPLTSKVNERGQLKSKKVFNEAGDKIMEESKIYAPLNTNDFIRSIATRRTKVASGQTLIEGTSYKIYTYPYKLLQETTKVYNQTDNTQYLTNTTNYVYNDLGQLKEVKKSQSDGSELITKMKYANEYEDILLAKCEEDKLACYDNCGTLLRSADPLLVIDPVSCKSNCDAAYNACKNKAFDQASAAILDMKNKHIWSQIEQLTYRNRAGVENIIAGSIALPKKFGSSVYPNKVFKLELNAPLPSVGDDFSVIGLDRKLAKHQNYRLPELEFVSFNDVGNPTEYIDRGGVSSAFVWGYNQFLPIAEVKNATYAQVTTALTPAVIDNLGGSTMADADIRSTINGLRSNTAFKVNSQTYDVIYGIKSITDASNITNYFEYDGLGRLKTVKDNAQNITKDLVYHFGRDTDNPAIGATATASMNYVATRIPRTAQTSIDTDPDKTTTTIQYLDGIGRPMQTVGYQASPSKTKDIIANSAYYDVYGRNYKNLLPTSSDASTGAYKNNAQTLATAFYNNDANPFDQTEFENSPLNRIDKTFGPGAAWRVGVGNATTNKYEIANSDVPYYTTNGLRILNGNGNYSNSTLYQNKVLDEKGHEKIEITDIDGKVIQRKTQADNGFLTTHYVYNDLNQLKAVIQPQGFPLATDLSKTDENLFFYTFDKRGRQIAKKVPAAEEEYTVYDTFDRPVLTQTALQRPANKWSFIKYDELNRTIMSGEKVIENKTQADLQTEANASTGRFESRNTTAPLFYTTSNSYPTIDSNTDKIYQINYFDDYANWATGLDFIASETSHTKSGTIGLATGSKVLNQTVQPNTWLRTANYYDYKSRIIQSQAENHLATEPNVTSMEYNFAGEVISKKTTHKKTNASDIIEITTSQYDHQGRTLATDHSIDAVPQTLAVYEYDEIGRLITKKINALKSQTTATAGNWLNPNTWQSGQVPTANSEVTLNNVVQIENGQTGYAAKINLNNNKLTINSGGVLQMSSLGTQASQLQKIDYSYHIRGGILGVNLDINQNVSTDADGDLFSYKLDYDFDNNIKRQSWKHANSPETRAYDYAYDPAKRLTQASYSPGGTYSTSNSYDRNGNLLTMNRNGVDQLTYNYQNGRLGTVTDAITNNPNTGDFRDNNTAGPDYEYYDDGSLKTDKNKGIETVIYDSYLKKVAEIKMTGGRYIKFYYDGKGELIQRKTSDNNAWDYVDDLIYQNGLVYQISQPEGRVLYQNNAWVYEYNYLDVWGNLRNSFSKNNSNATVVQAADFDPWGWEYNKTESVTNKNKFKYQKQERLDDFDLNLDLFKFRPSDSQIGRFWQVDPLAEKYNYNSVYAFQENKFGLGVELEGAEMVGFPLFGTSSLPIARPVVLPRTGPSLIENLSTVSRVEPAGVYLRTATQEHHLSPNGVKDHPVVQEARNEGFKQDGKENKMPVEKFDKKSGEGQHGNHPEYNKEVKNRYDEFKAENPNRTGKESLDFIRRTVNEMKDLIKNNPSTKINDLFRLKSVMPIDNTRVPLKINHYFYSPQKSNEIVLTPL